MRNANLYPENWKDEIRPAILLRDGFKCVRCRVKHRSYIFIDQNSKAIVVDRTEHEELKKEGCRTYRIYLQVAHVDNVKSNCEYSNLISLCPRCHHRQDKIYKSMLRLSNSVKISLQPQIQNIQIPR